MPHILVADSDSSSRQHLIGLLERARYQVSQVSDGSSTVRLVASQRPDLVLMEVLLPDQAGFEVCRRIRRVSDVPIMFLSSRSAAEDRIKGLRLGADDFLAKPFAPAELLARVGAVLRRVDQVRRPPTTALRRGTWALDPVQQVCSVGDGRQVDLTPREVHLLAFLMQRSGRVCTTSQIVRHIWGDAGRQARSIVATTVWRLRAKLEDDHQAPQHLLTIRNVGYKFEP